MVDSKFGEVALFRLPGRGEEASNCLGFMKNLDNPTLRISGWTCQGDTLPARRAAVGCMLNRLTLLGAGNEPKLAESSPAPNSSAAAAAAAPAGRRTG